MYTRVVTPRQAQLVRESFESVRSVGTTIVQLFYARLFSLDPGLRALFRHEMRDQSRKLADMLAAVVDSADNLEAVRPRLRELGRQHVAYGTTASHYELVASALLWTLGHVLEREFYPETRDAWATLVQEVNAEMLAGAAEAV